MLSKHRSTQKSFTERYFFKKKIKKGSLVQNDPL
jgi:hypothetical protein